MTDQEPKCPRCGVARPSQIRQVVNALEAVLSHYWYEESVDFHASASEARKEHIFASLEVLNDWLREREGFPEDW